MKTRALSGRRALIVEDELLIALDLEAMLGDVGMTVIGPLVTLDEAIHAAGSADVDVALLDVSLKGDVIWPAADIILGRHIPLLFLTGYSEFSIPLKFQSHPWLGKPIVEEQLLMHLENLLLPNLET